MKKIIDPNGPKAIGPYSHAILVNDTLYVSGQLGINPLTNELRQGLEEQTYQALANLSSILNCANVRINGIAKVTIYLTDMANFQTVNKIYGDFLEGHYPARVAIAVAQLPLNALVEIDAIAYKE